MKKQIHPSSRSEARPGNARSFIPHRGGVWPGLLLAACCALLTGLAHPARAAVTEAWVQRYDGAAGDNDYAQAVAVDGSGNVVVTGGSATEYLGAGQFIFDYYTAKYAAANGALLWEKRYNGPANGDDQALAVAVDGGGNVLVMGYSSNGTNNDYYTAKYAAADGALLWEQRYNGPANSGDAALAVALDSSGNVVVTGASGNETNSDYYTAKYAATNGALLWERRYNGPADNDDQAQAVAVDGSGNVVVTGYSYNTNFTSDYYTAKYAAADGALLWEKRYNGPENGFDSAQAVAVDGSGNVVVAGYSYATNGANYDSYTVKYGAADGELLWEKRGSNGPGNYVAYAVAVDSSGNVLITGDSWGTDFRRDCYTAKYAAADGALLWEKRHNGPANGDDYAQAVAVDGSDNVVVAGSSEGSGNTYDYYTAKYAAADGALLWEKRYNGPANATDSASRLALGPNGMVAVTGFSSGDYATVVYWENLPPLSIARVPTGIRLRFSGVSDRSYTIERASAVTGPWTTLATPTAPPGGLIEYVDTNAPVAAAFYRTSAP